MLARGFTGRLHTMIPKADGDSTLLGQRPLCVLPVVDWLWASVRLGHSQHWFTPGSLTLFKVRVKESLVWTPGMSHL